MSTATTWAAAAVAVGLLAAIAVRPGVWGLAGSLVYGLGVFRVTVYSEEGREPRVRARAWLQLVTCLLFGAVAAEGFGPTLAGWARGRVHPEAVWLVVGLSANSMWPVLERLLGGRLRKIIDAFLGS